MSKNYLINIIFVVTLSIIISIGLAYKSHENVKEKTSKDSALIISQMLTDSFNNLNKEKKHEALYNTISSIEKFKYVNSIHFEKSEDFDFADEPNKTKTQFTLKKDDNSILFEIPINAQWQTNSDCRSCHNIFYGEQVGVLKLDLVRVNDELPLIYFVPFIVLFTILFILYLAQKSIKQNNSSYIKLSRSLSFALNGKYKKVSSSSNVDIITKYNELIGVFEETTNFIDTKLRGYVGSNINKKNISALDESKNIISNLSDLYQFKKEIEHDNTEEEIFNRISEVFINKYNLKNFNFIQISNNKTKVLKEVGDSFYCSSQIKEDPSLCRAARINKDVKSIDYHHSCPYFTSKEKFHYCISTNIIKSTYLIVNFVFDTKEELNELKNKVSLIKSYINESVPAIEVKLLMRALKESAYTDGLTGLYNRKFLDLELKKLVPLAKRENYSIGVLLLDMDHFKAVNDEYGHDIGDKVLKELALILSETVRESDILVRYGGEEFLVLLLNVINEDNALSIANKIRENVAAREIDVYAGSKLKKTVSLGLSMYPQDSSNMESVIKNADIALYEAKNKGRNQVVRFTPEQVTSVDLF